MRPNIHRSRTGCLTCRTRKVKCDEQRPVCRQCHRGTRSCAWPRDNAPPKSPQPRPRRANDTACMACREKKLKCVGALHDACKRCGQLGLACRRRPAVRSAEDEALLPEARSQTLPHVFGSTSVTATLSLLDNLCRPNCLPAVIWTSWLTYFGFYSFIHRPRFTSLLAHGTAPRSLLLIMIACAMRFAAPTTPQNLAQADAWADAAIQATLPRVYEGFGAVQLMVLLLAQYYDLNRGRFTSAWLLGGNCTRMMQLMSLHTFDRTYRHKQHEAMAQLSPLLTPEALRRVAWSAFYADTITDGGRYGFHTLDASFYRLQLPCDRDRFLEDTPDVVTELVYPDQPPLSNSGSGSKADSSDSSNASDGATLDVAAYLIRTAAARRRALHFAFRASHAEGTVEQLTAELAAIEADIAMVTESLPAELRFTQKNIERHQDRLIMFLLLHIFRHNLSIVAGRAALLVYRRSTDARHANRIMAVRRSRIAHALPIAELAAESTRAGIALDPQFGVHAYVALEILFEPRRLEDVDPWPSTSPPDMNDVLPHLLAVIREVATRSDFVKQLVRMTRSPSFGSSPALTDPVLAQHIEAVHRLLRCDCIHLLRKEDFGAFYSEYRLVGQETAEYDFRDFPWAKLEWLKHGVRPPGGNDLAMANDESLFEYNVDSHGGGEDGDVSVPVEGNTGSNGTAAPPPQINHPWWGVIEQSQAAHDCLPADLSWLLDESGYTEYQTGDPTIFWNQLHYI
ncbi:hypothetical protein SCUCBS95973_008825 [Sporothrix curviconia]|uniref:Zn(2)-C6 fungal-type domain-containing protein n=1 Tax=Sporothrix curviconia TaxID=1260050 RepID=A0ABP0CPU6_9PEZI